MFLFILGWNFTPDSRSRLAILAKNSMREVIKNYPQIDQSTLQLLSKSNYLLASAQNNQKISPNRKYIAQSDDQIAFYSGYITDHEGQFNANDANNFFSWWNVLPARMDGQFVVLRISSKPDKLVVITDFLGLEQVYFCKVGNGVLIANSVELLREVSGFSSLDELGLSTFLSLGWAGADKTLIDGINTLSGGRIFTWEVDQSDPTVSAYYSISQYVDNRKYLKPDIDNLQASLLKTLHSLADYSTELYCPLTGGRDSRLVAALLKATGIKARYFTLGEEFSDDVHIARQISDRLNLEYEHRLVNQQNISDAWDKICNKLICQNDGLVSLWQIQDVLFQQDSPSKLPVILTGFGGEIARGYLSPPIFLLFGNNREYAQNFIFRNLLLFNDELLKKNTIIKTERYIHKFWDEAIENGFSPIDFPNLFSVLDKMPRWVGSNSRKYKPDSDTFSILSVRPFVDTAFLYSVKERYVEPVHYQLIKKLAPELNEIPYTQGRWESQVPNLSILQFYLHWPIRKFQSTTKLKSAGLDIDSKHKAFHQNAWFEAQINQIRSLILDNQRCSPLWDFVNRENLERILSKNTDTIEREENIQLLYNILTVAQYSSINN